MRRILKWLNGILLVWGLVNLFLVPWQEGLSLELLLLYLFLDDNALPKTRPTTFQVCFQGAYLLIFPLSAWYYGLQDRMGMLIILLLAWLMVFTKLYHYYRLWRKTN